MDVDEVIVPGDELRVAGGRGDEPVETLAKVADRERTIHRRAADGKVEIQQFAPRVVGWQPALPSAPGLPRELRMGTVARKHLQSVVRFRKQAGTLLLVELGRQGACGQEHAPR